MGTRPLNTIKNHYSTYTTCSGFLIYDKTKQYEDFGFINICIIRFIYVTYYYYKRKCFKNGTIITTYLYWKHIYIYIHVYEQINHVYYYTWKMLV